MQNFYLGNGTKNRKKSSPTTLSPEVLFKRSRFFYDFATGAIMMQGVHHELRFGPNADAKCAVGKSHRRRAIDPSCSCGFYAYKYYHDALEHPQASSFLLRVVASGDIFEYDRGYRYSHQRLEEVTATHCTIKGGCSTAPDRLAVSKNTGEIYPLCSQHGNIREDGNWRLISFSAFEATISGFLPAGAPDVTIRSVSPKVTPWERGKKLPLFQRLQKAANNQGLNSISVVEMGAITLAGVILGKAAVRGIVGSRN